MGGRGKREEKVRNIGKKDHHVPSFSPPSLFNERKGIKSWENEEWRKEEGKKEKEKQEEGKKGSLRNDLSAKRGRHLTSSQPPPPPLFR